MRVLVMFLFTFLLSFLNPKPYPLDAAEYVPRTTNSVTNANLYDYSVTISESGDRLSADEIGTLIKDYGTYGTTLGMPAEEYRDAMEYAWRFAKLPRKTELIADIDVDLTKKYTYKDLVALQKIFAANFDGVFLYKIGESTEGRSMYALEVDLTNCKPEEKHTVLLTGQVHARETAGPVYILKELMDFVKAYYGGNKRARDAAKTTRFVAVACVNPDGHDGIGFDTQNWTYSDGTLWKATSNGTDLNRNFPGLSWMQLKYGVEQTKYRSNTPDKVYYWGDYAGSCNETKAMMKFYQYFIGVEHAEMLIDYHQQGRITYAGKSYAPKYNNDLSEALRKACYKAQTKGTLGTNYGRVSAAEEDTAPDYGLNGTGSTNTDYAWAVAMGAKFSTKYGFSVHVDKNGNEYPLVMIPEYDKATVRLQPMNSPEFRSLSWEIGYEAAYLGYSDSARSKIAKEYYNYNFDEMLYVYAEQLK